jgi:hypothetical protein
MEDVLPGVHARTENYFPDNFEHSKPHRRIHT